MAFAALIPMLARAVAGAATRSAAFKASAGASIKLAASNAAKRAAAAVNPKSLAAALGTAKKSAGNFGRGMAQSLGNQVAGAASRFTGAAPQVAAPSVNATINRPGNFGDILSGKTTASAAQTAAQSQDQQAADDEKKKANAEALNAATTKLVMTMAGGPLAVTGFLAAGKKFAEVLSDSQAHLAKYNGAIQHSQALLQRGNILRDRATAGATANTSAALTDSVNAMKDELRPIGDAATNMMNLVGAGLAILVTNTAKTVKAVMGLNDTIWKKWFGAEDKTRNDWDQWLSDLKAGHGKGRRRAPNNPPPPVPPKAAP